MDSGWALNPTTDVFTRRGEDTQRQEGHVATGAESEVMLPQPEEHLGPPGAERGEEDFFPGAFRGSTARPTLSLQAPSLQNCERISPVVLSHPVRETLS